MAGNGRGLGIGGGFVRLGHWQIGSDWGAPMVSTELADWAASASPIVGNVPGISSRSAQASLLRNSLSVLSVT